MNIFTETVEESWFDRMKKAIAGLVIAPIFVLVGFLTLRHGEMEHAATTKALINIITKVQESPEEGKLFHATDSIYGSRQELKDNLIDLKINTNKLFREVLTYQWNEVIKKKRQKNFLGNTTSEVSYTYKKEWRSELINSDNFKHKQHVNPKKRAFKHYKTEQKQLKFGELNLGKDLHKYLLNYRPLKIGDLNLKLKNKMTLCTAENQYLGTSLLYMNNRPVYFSRNGQLPLNQGASDISHSKCGYSNKTLETDVIYVGDSSINNPQIGDSKISYWHIPNNKYSLVGELNNNTINSYKKDSLFIQSELPGSGIVHSKLGHFALMSLGELNKIEMFKDVHKKNDIMFVVLRFVGLLLMVGGFALFGNPLRILFSWLPFVGNIWEKIVFKIMLVLGSLTSIVISVYYFLLYNSLSNLTIYDFYFGIVVILFMIFCRGLSVSAGSYSEDF